MKPQTIETQLAAQRLRKLQPGETCAYEELRAAIGIDPQEGKGYGYVSSARSIVERELECVFECVPNVGVKRLLPREVINRGGRDLKHVRKSVRHGLRRQTTIVPLSADLPPEERTRVQLNMSYFGMLDAVTRPSNRKVIEAKIQDAARVLPPAETLEFFTNKGKQ